jgi:hypothetical protein
MFATLDRATMGLWEALQLLGELREYEAALLAEGGQTGAAGPLDPDMPLLEHAFQAAELLRCAAATAAWLRRQPWRLGWAWQRVTAAAGCCRLLQAAAGCWLSGRSARARAGSPG